MCRSATFGGTVTIKRNQSPWPRNTRRRRRAALVENVVMARRIVGAPDFVKRHARPERIASPFSQFEPSRRR